MRLGLLPHDPDQLAATPPLYAYRLPAQPPDRLVRSHIAYQPRLGDNRELPDCTAESLREVATAQSYGLRGTDLAVADDASRRFYAACLGTPNATPEELKLTEGADMLTVAAHQLAHGFEAGAGRYYALYGRLPLDRTHLADAAFTFGMAQLGLALYRRDIDRMFGSDPLDDDGTDPGPMVGMHALGGPWEWRGLQADTDVVVLVTYGTFRTVTWRWLLGPRARLRIALAYRWRQLDPAGMAAVDEDALSQALRGMVVS